MGDGVGFQPLFRNQNKLRFYFRPSNFPVTLPTGMGIRTDKRQLTFRMSAHWSGWFCERCCWSVPLPANRYERDEVASKIEEQFAGHDCERFAREDCGKST
jgi:hypothetical protein